MFDLSNIDQEKLNAVVLHPFDCYVLGKIVEKATNDTWWEDLFKGVPDELKSATAYQKWLFFEKLIKCIENYMVSTFQENEEVNGSWFGREVLYARFIQPALEEVFTVTKRGD